MGADDVHIRFETTRWSLVQRLHGSDDERSVALDELSRIYRPVVYSYLRRRGLQPDDADEATQDFFETVVLSRALFDHADPARRLRTLILTALQRREIDRARRRKARGGPHLSLDALNREEALLASDLPGDPAQAFERRWATAQVEEAMRRCESHYLAACKPGHWAIFEARVVRPAISPCAPVPTADIAAACGFRTPADANAAVQTVKKRFTSILREVVAETLPDECAVDEEYERIRTVLGEGRANEE